MINRILRGSFLLLLLFLAGCSSLQSIDLNWINRLLNTATPAPVSPQTGTSTPIPVPTQVATGNSETQSAPKILRIWLPPQFDPNANNPAAALLKQRLKDFEINHPGLEVDVRIKSEAGDANLLDSLSITSLAAPSALPDLVALPRNDLEAAAQKKLIKSLNITEELQNPVVYPYARQLAEIDGTPYGIPFAGDALVMVYRPNLVWIKSWDDILLSQSQLMFAGADPQAETALALYTSAGGELTDASGKPTLDQDILVQVLNLFAKGRGVTLFPDAVKNISSDDQVLDEYRNRRTDLAIFHYSKYRSSQDSLYQPLMGLGDEPHFTFARGWTWALTGRNPETQLLAKDLAEYLTEEEFLAPWIKEAGYLPTRRFSGNGQPDQKVADVINAAQPLPSADTIKILGPLMQDAVVRVLNGEDPETVARSVIEKLG